MKNRWTIRLAGEACSLGLLLLLVTAAPAQDFTVDATTFYTGTQSSGGDFSLMSNIGQADAGVSIAAGDFLLIPGFWSALGPTSPTLTIFRDAAEIVISWPESAGPDFLLEEADNFLNSPANTNWSPVAAHSSLVGASYQVRIPIGSANQFFRLHKP